MTICIRFLFVILVSCKSSNGKNAFFVSSWMHVMFIFNNSLIVKKSYTNPIMYLSNFKKSDILRNEYMDNYVYKLIIIIISILLGLGLGQVQSTYYVLYDNPVKGL